MKKSMIALLLAAMMCLACGAALAQGTDGGAVYLTLNIPGHEYQYGLPVGSDGSASVSAGDMSELAVEYLESVQAAGQAGAGLDVQLLTGSGYDRLSQMILQLTSLSDCQAIWHQQLGGGNLTSVPITIRGRKAGVTFDTDAQNDVRRAAMIRGGAQAIDLFVRRAIADVTGGTYPAGGATIEFAIQALSELSDADFTARQRAVFEQNAVLGGARVKVAMALGSAKPFAMTALEKGSVTLTTPVTLPAGADMAHVKALRVSENGKTALVPVTVKNGVASITADHLGDYIVVYDPDAQLPATGDEQSLTLWAAMLALAAAGAVIVRRKVRA